MLEGQAALVRQRTWAVGPIPKPGLSSVSVLGSLDPSRSKAQIPSY